MTRNQDTNYGYSFNESRNLFLVGEVTQEKVEKLMQQLADFAAYDEELQAHNFEPKPIYLHIDSEGGSVYHGFALIGAMEYSVAPIYTFCYGMAMSMALAIFLAGDIRFVHRHAQLMYHEISSLTIGSITDHKKSVAHMDHLQEMYDEFVTSHSNVEQENLDTVKEEKDEWFISADTAKKLGMADYILPITPEQLKEQIETVEE